MTALEDGRARSTLRARGIGSVLLGVSLWCCTPPARPLPAASASVQDAAPAAHPSSTVYQNPIIPGFYPDPSICRVGSDYYLVTSSFEYFPGVPVFHSRDLIHWRQIAHALTRGSQLDLTDAGSSKGIFAPTLRYHDGTFYMVTTNVSRGGNFYVTTRDPAGEWSEPHWLGESEGIDPSLLFASDGRVYYTREGGGERGGIYAAELDRETGKLRSPARQVWAGTGGIWPEGPHLYEIDGRYYLMISEGGTSTGHGLTIARSSSPFGPFEANPNNPILSHAHRPAEPIQATGHGDLVQAPDGRWWVVFLGIRRWDGQNHHLGRETFLAPVTWNDAGWPVINGGAPIALQMSAEGLPPAQPGPEQSPRDDFAEPRLALDWNFLRNPRSESWSLAQRPGFLRLHGSTASLDDVGAPAFIGRRQRHHRSHAATQLDFTPSAAGQRAGLAVRANEANHYELYISAAANGRQAVLRTLIAGAVQVVASAAIPMGPVTLTGEAYPDRYEFSATDATGAVHTLGSAPTAPLSSEKAGGFTGVYLGVFATTQNDAAMPPADFDWFDYRSVRND
jgi:xylan 1,4-beta-xylosidase